MIALRLFSFLWLEEVIYFIFPSFFLVVHANSVGTASADREKTALELPTTQKKHPQMIVSVELLLCGCRGILG